MKLKLETCQLECQRWILPHADMAFLLLENKMLLEVRECLDMLLFLWKILSPCGLPRRSSDGDPRLQRSRPRVVTQ